MHGIIKVFCHNTLSALLCLSICSFNNLIKADEGLISILDNPGLNHFKATLHEIVKERAPELSNSQHHFYVARYSADATITFMLWQEGRRLWIFSPGNADATSWSGIRYPAGGQLINLDTDVVADAEAVGSSTYLVSRAWVHEKVFEAVVNGDQLVIEMQ